jgi:hypothetical protein
MKSKELTKKKKKEEAKRGRTEASFHLSKDQKNRVDNFVAKLRLPSGVIKRPFAHSGFVKSHDWVVLQTDIGKYIMGSNIKGDHAFFILRFFSWVKSVMTNTITSKEIDQLEADIPVLLSEMEVLFPVFMSSMNFHLLMHLPQTLRDFGPAVGHQMYYIERFNRLLKSTVKVSPLIFASIFIRYASINLVMHLIRAQKTSVCLSLLPFCFAKPCHPSQSQVSLSLQQWTSCLSFHLPNKLSCATTPFHMSFPSTSIPSFPFPKLNVAQHMQSIKLAKLFVLGVSTGRLKAFLF